MTQYSFFPMKLCATCGTLHSTDEGTTAFRITSTDHYVFHIPSVSAFLSLTFISKCLYNHMIFDLRKLLFVGRSCAKWTKDDLILIYVNDHNKLWIKIVLAISSVWWNCSLKKTSQTVQGHANSIDFGLLISKCLLCITHRNLLAAKAWSILCIDSEKSLVGAYFIHRLKEPFFLVLLHSINSPGLLSIFCSYSKTVL